jgi:hypothetical protein
MWKKLMERDNLEDLGVDRSVILNFFKEIVCEDMYGIDLAQERN